MKMNAMYLMIKLFVDKFQKNPFKKKNHLTANVIFILFTTIILFFSILALLQYFFFYIHFSSIFFPRINNMQNSKLKSKKNKINIK